MKLEVRGKNGFEVTNAIENYADEKLSKLERYFKEELDAAVVCKTYNDHHRVEVTIPTTLFTMRAEVSEEDMYAAIDLAIDKLESQIRKHKTKVNRSLRKREGVNDLFNEDVDLDALERELVGPPVRKKQITPEEMSSEEAITAMDMLGHDFYIYKDSETKRINILYLRNDGDYAVIEAQH